MSECFSYHYLIKNKNYDFYLSILVSERGAPFFWQPPVYKPTYTPHYRVYHFNIFCFWMLAQLQQCICTYSWKTCSYRDVMFCSPWMARSFSANALSLASRMFLNPFKKQNVFRKNNFLTKRLTIYLVKEVINATMHHCARIAST